MQPFLVPRRGDIWDECRERAVQYEAALREKDYAAQVLLQWFINEQVEEEAWTDELIARVQRAECPGGLAELDRHIERHLTQNVAEEE